MLRENAVPCKWLKGGDLRALEKEVKPQHINIEQQLPRNHNVNVDCFQPLKSTHRHSRRLSYDYKTLYSCLYTCIHYKHSDAKCINITDKL